MSQETHPVQRHSKRTLLNEAWHIIADVSAGNWNLQNHEWQRTAAKWRDCYEHVPAQITCEWVEQEGEYYKTECGRACFVAGTLTENNYSYCPNCGRAIILTSIEEKEKIA